MERFRASKLAEHPGISKANTRIYSVTLNHCLVFLLYFNLSYYTIKILDIIKKTMRIKLTPLTLNRTEDYLRWFNNQQVRKYLDKETPKTKGEISKWLKRTIKESLYFSIFLIGENINIGHVGIKNINKANKSAKIGIVIGEIDFQRKGIGKEAVNLILEKCKSLGLRKITAKIQRGNKASYCLFTRLEFKPISTQDKQNLHLEYLFEQ